jgi:pimeloyl-ACP methyl ester carboxylesterase
MSGLPNIVLVHGAWADGSSWSAVIERLQDQGYRVTAPQFPLTSLADDSLGSARSLRSKTAPRSSPAIPTVARSSPRSATTHPM